MAKQFELQARHFIDSHKCASVVAILFCIVYHRAWHNTAACLYLATHGVYGLLWALKSQVFPDKRFFQPIGAGEAIFVWSMLSAPTIALSGPVSLLFDAGLWPYHICTTRRFDKTTYSALAAQDLALQSLPRVRTEP